MGSDETEKEDESNEEDSDKRTTDESAATGDLVKMKPRERVSDDSISGDESMLLAKEQQDSVSQAARLKTGLLMLPLVKYIDLRNIKFDKEKLVEDSAGRLRNVRKLFRLAVKMASLLLRCLIRQISSVWIISLRS